MDSKARELYVIDQNGPNLIETGRNLRKLREGLRLKQKDVAEKYGIARETLSQMERGTYHFGLAAVERYCRALAKAFFEKDNQMQEARLVLGI